MQMKPLRATKRYILSRMSCYQTFLSPSPSEFGDGNAPNPEVVSTSGPSLFVSNAPEEILLSSEKPRVNLWKVTLPFVSATRIRCFIWHYNNTDWYAGLALRAECASGSATITNVSYQEFVGPQTDLSIPGTCLAFAQLYQTLDPQSPPALIELEPSSGPANIRVWNMGPKPANGFALACAVLEFDLAGMGELRLWTSASLDATFCAYTTALEPEGNPGNPVAVHVRGCWPYSAALLQITSALDAKFVETPNPPVTRLRRDMEICGKIGEDVSTNTQLGPEQILFCKANSLNSEHATDNRGCYGANFKYRFFVFNSGPETGLIQAFLVARNTGAKYWGAGRLTLPIPAYATSLAKFPIDIQEPEVHLRHIQLNDGLPPPKTIPVAGNSGSQPIEIELTNAGGATLPINYQIAKLCVFSEPVEGPQ